MEEFKFDPKLDGQAQARSDKRVFLRGIMRDRKSLEALSLGYSAYVTAYMNEWNDTSNQGKRG